MSSQNNMENLPIDIHYNKLLDWLISRRHCSQQWQSTALTIREKINLAIQDMPPVEEITKLLQGTYINYFHCKKIADLLKSTDSGAKNIFGQYSSQKMKDWQEILKLYEKDGVYLAEAAQLLTRNVNYEIPALKKQIGKCQQIQTEGERKESEYISNAAKLKKEYNDTCKQMGIEGKKIKSELATLVRDMPSVFDKLAKKSKGLEGAVQYYSAFMDFIMNRSDLGASAVPMLRYVQQKGSTTTYEWQTGHKPSQVIESAINIDTADEVDKTADTGDIDWGDIGTGEEVDYAADIDFDISEVSVEGVGIETVDGGEEVGTGGNIDWGTGEVTKSDQSSSKEGVAQGENALSLLDNPKTRNLFVDDLSELECFLAQRLVELGGEGDVLSGSHSQSAPASIQVDVTKVTEMLEAVRAITTELTSVQMHHLMLIRNSPRYVDRLTDTLKQKLQLADKMVFYQKQSVAKRNQALEEQRDLEPKLDVIIQRTKELQKQMQKEISKKYKDRPVNIMGEINTI
ncbi:CDK5 regulatory subunit-associated protein 3-like isoform X2 [Liolophura sinensis]